MLWNLGLAAIPLLLSVVLFRRATRRGIAWWLGVGVFVLFLPNAPYVVTDVVHLIEAMRAKTYSTFVLTLVVIPAYAIFVTLGFGAYVVSVLNVCAYLRRLGRASWVVPAELALHAASAVGIYLGRFERFNSWAVVTDPDDLTDTLLEDVLARGPVAAIAATFVVVSAFYWPSKWVTRRSLAYRRGRPEDAAAR